MERWNLKAATFVSLVFHSILLFTAATLFSGATIHQPPIRIVKVSISPLENEIRPVPQPTAPPPFKNRPQRPEMKESVQETESLIQKEVKAPILLPVQATEIEIPAERPKVIPPAPEEKDLKESPRPVMVATLNPNPALNLQPLFPFSSPSGGVHDKSVSEIPGKEGEGTRQGDPSGGGGPGYGTGIGTGGGRWKGLGDGSRQVGSLGGGAGSGAGFGTGSSQGDGYKGGSGKGKTGGGTGSQPYYADNPKPPYPREARNRGYQGEVLLRVEVLSSGKVGQIEIKRSSGYDMLDQSALSTVKQWKFIPAKRGEETVPLWVNIPIRFQIQ
jgi:protein TonB